MAGFGTIDEARIGRVRRLHALYQSGKIPVPAAHEVHPSLPIESRENYLYFTLSCCLNFQRSSIALWRSALDTFEDQDCHYLFFPEVVADRSFDDVRRDLTKHRLALQVNRHPRIWVDICRTLLDHYESDPRNILVEGDFDAVRIIRSLQIDRKELFPYLGGRKLSNYWLFILSRFTHAPLRNLDQISIIPDTNVIKSTVRLGLAKPGVTPTEIEDIWRSVSRALDLPGIELHPVLWNWARNGFLPAV